MLSQHGLIRQYLQVAKALCTNPVASALDERFKTVRANLVARQRAGGGFIFRRSVGILRPVFELTANPRIEARDYAPNMDKGYLANVGAVLNNALELDIVTIARS